MNIAVIREKIRRAGFHIPFRVHLLLLVIALLLAAGWLRKNNAVPETAHTAIVDLFISVTFWFAFTILVISFISAFVPWVISLFSKKKSKKHFKNKNCS
jgi:chromate transport protein ChrA